MSGFGGQVAALHAGSEYQARYFWLEALRLFRRGHVKSVAFERPGSGKFDDVVTQYEAGHLRSTLAASRDGAQLKYHVVNNGVVGWSAFTDPSFLGSGSKVSLVEAVLDAYQTHRDAFFSLVTPWTLDSNDALRGSCRNDDRRLRLDDLFNARRGALAQARKQMLALSGDNTDILRAALSRVVLWHGVTLKDVTDRLDDNLAALGIEPIGDRLGSPLDGLPYDYLRHGALDWNRAAIANVLEKEIGWKRPVMTHLERRCVGVRQFLNFAEHLEDGTDAFLDLTDRMSERRPREGEDWNGTILPAVREFVRSKIQSHRSVELKASASLSIAFAIGASIHPRAPLHLFVEQSGSLWDMATQSNGAEPNWEISETETGVRSDDVVVCVSVSRDVESAVRAWIHANGVTASRIVHFRVASVGRGAIRDGAHAVALAQSIAHRLPIVAAGGTLHLFAATPQAFMVAFGRFAEAPRTQLYEFVFENVSITNEYFPSILIDRTKEP